MIQTQYIFFIQDSKKKKNTRFSYKKISITLKKSRKNDLIKEFQIISLLN